MVISPTFFGAEPDVIDEGKHNGLTLFRGEELSGLKLMQSLSPELQKQAQLYPNVSLPTCMHFLRLSRCRRCMAITCRKTGGTPSTSVT